MTISYVGGNKASAISGADPSIDLTALTGGSDSSPSQNDIVIVGFSIGDNDNVDQDMTMTTAGYTEITDLFNQDPTIPFDVNLGVFWKVMGASPDTTAVANGLGGTDAAVAEVCMVFRGVDTSTPMDVTVTTATQDNTFSPDPPSISPATAGAWVLIVGAAVHNLGGAGSFTFPSGYTTDAISQGSDDTSDTTIGMGYNSSPASPTENPGAMTHSGSDSVNFAAAAVTIALRPAAAVTTKFFPVIVGV